MYANSLSKPAAPGAPPQYHVHQVKAFSMISDPETWRQGARAYRNSIDLAKEYRDKAIEQANAAADRTLAPPNPQVRTAPAYNNCSTSFDSTIPNTSSAFTMGTESSQGEITQQGFQIEDPRSPHSDNFHTAANSPEAEDDPVLSFPIPAKRPSKPRGRRESQRKRQNETDTEDTEEPSVPSGRAAPKASHSSSSTSQNKRRGKKKAQQSK